MGAWDFDLDGKSADQVERSAGPLPDGYYKFKFTETSTSPENGDQVLKMQVTYGPFAGKIHTEYLKSPLMAETSDAKRMRGTIAIVYLKRFGIVPGEVKAVNNPDWPKIVGQEGIMQIRSREWSGKDKDGKPKSGLSHEVPIGKVWPLTHPEVATFKNDVRAAVGLQPIAGGGSSTPAAAANGSAGSASPGTSGATPGAAVPSGSELAAKLWD